MIDGDNLKISVVIRTYKREKFLKRALKSIEIQNYDNWEVLIYDDCGNSENLDIVNDFKLRNSNKRVLYTTSFESYDLFKKSWFLSVDDSEGEILVRLDDDDVLNYDSLSYINYIYKKYPSLDFSYGSSAIIKDNQVIKIMETKTPHELPKTKHIWTGYIKEDNHPWNNPWSFTENYYTEPKHYTSIIHASKANQLCVYHTYVMRKSSIKNVINKITITSHTHDDLEFFGSLEYLGLSHTSLKKILTFVDSHTEGRVTETKNIIEESYRVRDKVEYLRVNNFETNIHVLEKDDIHSLDCLEVINDEFKILERKLTSKLKFEKCFLFYITSEYLPVVEHAIKSIRQYSNIPILVYTLNSKLDLPLDNVTVIPWFCEIRNDGDNIYYPNHDENQNKYIDRNKSRIYDTLIQRPSIVKHALSNFSEIVCYLDADTIVLPNIEDIFNFMERDSDFPYFTEGIHDYMIWEGRGNVEKNDNLTNTLEFPICKLFNIDQNFRKQSKYRQTGYFLCGQKSLEFLDEWIEMCNNEVIKSNNRYYAPYHEETIVNCLLWKKKIDKGLPLVYVNGSVGTIQKINNEWNFNGNKQHIDTWIVLPPNRNDLFFVHGEKRPIYLEKMILENNKNYNVDPSKNWGDIVSDKIIEFFSEKKISKDKVFHFDKEGLMLSKNGKLHCVGSTLDYTKPNDYIWGTGCIKPDSVGEPPKKIYSVRGPLTQKELQKKGIDCPSNYGDPALLFPLIYNPKVEQKYQFGLIPHYIDYRDKDSLRIIENLEREGVKIINITSGIEEVVNQILEVKFVLSSSLHGIIIADAYKIPNTKVELSNLVIGGDFKFIDYYLSVGKDYKSYKLTMSTEKLDFNNMKFQIPNVDLTMDILSSAPWLDGSNEIFNKKIKLLFLAPHLSTGGMPGFLLKRIEVLKKHESNIEIFVVEYSNYSPLYTVQKNKIKQLVGDRNYWTLGSDKFELIDIIKNNNIDIIHVEEILEGFDFHNQVPVELLNQLYSNNRTWRIIETCHNVWFDPKKSKKYNPDGFAFCTPFHERYTFAGLPSQKKLISFPIEDLIPNEKDKFECKRRLGFDLDKIHVLNVGLWTPGKNQKQGLEIARNVWKINPNIVFHFVGNQAPNFSEYWEPLMNDLPENVNIWGEKDNISDFMKASDVFMFNSTWECSPLVLKEAISHGLKIIAKNLPQYLNTFDEYIIELSDDSIVSSNILLETIDREVKYEIPKNDLLRFENDHINFYNEIMINPIQTQIIKSSEININQHFVEQPFLEITGKVENPDTKFDIIFFDENDKIQYQNKLPINHWVKLNRRYFTKWKSQVFQDGTLIHENILDFENKRVYIAFDSKSLGDSIAWIPYCLEFKMKHNCEVIVSTFWNKLFKSAYHELQFVNPGEVVNNLHGMYKLGWFYNADYEPTLPHVIPLQKTATNILGLEYKEISPRLSFEPSKRIIKEKYVTIATNSTAGCKFWTKNGWQSIINYLHEQGFKVINVSKEDNPFKNCTKIKDTSIEYTMNTIHHSEFFIGLSSGLSWLAWALGKKVVMISNFSESDHEFTTNCIRMTNLNVCNGCWNNPNFRFDKGDWNWCPVNKGTKKQFECQKSITSEMVIEKLNELI